jgi:hypothetical protein
MKNNDQKGVSILLSLLVMTAILSIAFGVSKLVIGEIKIGRDISRSVVAYYAADSAVERAIFEKRINNIELNINDCSVDWGSGSFYGAKVQVSGSGNNIVVIVKASGCYNNTKRAIEASF